ncbi:MAG TPA: type II toxin-antitoxin system VapC family toxin [Oligoflexia bacterium]|nr:type II toxin-antitoxin system VapC family toxin [Oligoflexia bacterium]HMP48955.1 type II toxin-antitoxin system VapC family toxin [Oligoflexia bacterium]
MEIILDTTFLIDLEREINKSSNKRPASDFLEKNLNATYQITIVTVGEFAEGLHDSDYDKFREYLMPFQILPIDQEVAWIYGHIAKNLRSRGNLIGTNDLWIAAIAIRNKKTLATRNIKDFKRITELEVVVY